MFGSQSIGGQGSKMATAVEPLISMGGYLTRRGQFIDLCTGFMGPIRGELRPFCRAISQRSRRIP